jgi:hypothetical protein
MNCWDFKSCGRGPGGSRVDEFGVCPAATDTGRNGINGGEKAGRHCWWVAGTLCEDEPQGPWASKLKDCVACDFFRHVREEEGDNFQP